MALREADRLQPERLTQAAADALSKLVKKDFAPTALRQLRREHVSPSLPGMADLESPNAIGVHADVVACGHANDSDPVSARSALEGGLFRRAWSFCREVEAVMLAERDPQATEVVKSFRSAISDAVGRAASALLSEGSLDRSAIKLDLDESLLAGVRP